MKKEKKTESNIKPKESVEELKKETEIREPLHKGYNEKNPTQPQGAFTPDSKTGK